LPAYIGFNWHLLPIGEYFWRVKFFWTNTPGAFVAKYLNKHFKKNQIRPDTTQSKMFQQDSPGLHMATLMSKDNRSPADAQQRAPM